MKYSTLFGKLILNYRIGCNVLDRRFILFMIPLHLKQNLLSLDKIVYHRTVCFKNKNNLKFFSNLFNLCN